MQPVKRTFQVFGKTRQRGETDVVAASVTTGVEKRLAILLPPETLVFPGLDPGGRTVSTIAEEKVLNPCFNGRSRDAFVTRMSIAPLHVFPQAKVQK